MTNERVDYFDKALEVAALAFGEVMSNPAEAKILMYLVGGPRIYTEITEATGIASGGLQRYLKRLREKGLIEKHTALNRPYYDLTQRGYDVTRGNVSIIVALDDSGELKKIISDDRGLVTIARKTLQEIQRTEALKELVLRKVFYPNARRSR